MVTVFSLFIFCRVCVLNAKTAAVVHSTSKVDQPTKSSYITQDSQRVEQGGIMNNPPQSPDRESIDHWCVSDGHPLYTLTLSTTAIRACPSHNLI